MPLLTISTRSFDKDVLCTLGFISPHKFDKCEDVEGEAVVGGKFADDRLEGDTFEVVELFDAVTI